MAIDPNKWTVKTQEAFNAALDAAKTANHPEVGPDHLLAALLAQGDGIVAPLLRNVGVDPTVLKRSVDERLGRQPKAYGSDAGMSRTLRDTLERADTARAELHDEYLSTEHLLLAMSSIVGATSEELLQALQTVR